MLRRLAPIFNADLSLSMGVRHAVWVKDLINQMEEML